ncbi:MAG TPA: DivIVA domain-containing protein [Clostridiales bacterium]|jgi:cell division initiation protein|nr:DivIVA domain-containing protein [Clostridiales bacterium]
MLTPSEIREKIFKNGLGYDKKDVEQFIQEISDDYEQLLAENENLNKKVKDLTDSISYYKSIEKTLQKALVIAEKTAQDIKNNAYKEAEAIEMNAKANAKMIESKALKQSEILEHKTLNLLKQYELFKAHFKNLLNAQIELINSESFQINTLDFSYDEILASQPENAKLDSSPKEDTNIKASLDTEDAFEFIAIDEEL